LTGPILHAGDDIEVFGVGVEFVVAQLVLDPEQDEDGTSHPHGQPGDIEG
jgi:hypothetical protein